MDYPGTTNRHSFANFLWVEEKTHQDTSVTLRLICEACHLELPMKNREMAKAFAFAHECYVRYVGGSWDALEVVHDGAGNYIGTIRTR